MALNPVERRLALLCADWLEFRADGARRLLVWQVPENAMRLLQCFFEAQKHELEYSTRDLFISFDAAFEHSVGYGRELKLQLKGQYAASRADFAAQGVASDWPFDPAALADTGAGVAAALRSFGAHHGDHIGHLAAVLLPQRSSDDDAFAAWVLRLLAADLPERLRIVVVDSLEHPRFARLDPAADARIARREPAIDALATAQETFAQEPTSGPAGVFRNLLMGVVALMEKGSADQVRAHAVDALAFARQQRWPDQEVVLRVMVAGALLKEARHAEAVQVYRVARQAADQALVAAHPAGRKLALQTWFGEAGAELAAGDAQTAAERYDAAAQVALLDDNPLMALEAIRMAAFCHARRGDREGAIERGVWALELGAELDPEGRPLTTLPVAAVDLLRAVEPEPVRRLEQTKWRLQQALDSARRRAETAATALEADPDPTAGPLLAARLEGEQAAAQAAAERQVDSIVAAASPDWCRHFAEARRLLGDDWPLRSALALQPLADAAAAPAAEGAAS